MRPGKILSIWGDDGWGDLVRQGKTRDGHFDDELVEACLELIRDWDPEPAPTWVTCIPSLRRPTLVSDFARRLADALGLPFHTAIEQIEDRAEQRIMANSSQQANNVDGTMKIEDDGQPAGPVLLVDDTVDSRWTLTFAAWLLTGRGMGPVHPLALASTIHTDER